MSYLLCVHVLPISVAQPDIPLVTAWSRYPSQATCSILRVRSSSSSLLRSATFSSFVIVLSACGARAVSKFLVRLSRCGCRTLSLTDARKIARLCSDSLILLQHHSHVKSLDSGGSNCAPIGEGRIEQSPLQVLFALDSVILLLQNLDELNLVHFFVFVHLAHHRQQGARRGRWRGRWLTAL